MKIFTLIYSFIFSLSIPTSPFSDINKETQLEQSSSDSICVKTQYAQNSMDQPARAYINLGYTNRGLPPSYWIVRNKSRDFLITVTIRYDFTYDRVLQRYPASEFETVAVAPGQEVTLKYARKRNNFSDPVSASVTGAYFGR